MKVIVIGGGPAGMMCAATAASNADVTLIEKNEKLGKKLYITGKGRANVTNVAEYDGLFDNIVNNSKFMYSAIYTFDNYRTMEFYEKLGVPLKTERGGRVFPLSDKSNDIIKAHIKHLEANNVNVMLNTEVQSIEYDNNCVKGVRLSDGRIIHSDAIVIACGGKSYSATGSTGDGYKFAKMTGHNIVPIRPALVPIILKDTFDLQGLSLKNVKVSITNSNNKVLYSEFGEMLFTDKGVSGPVILSLSSIINKLKIDELNLVIDLKPALDLKQLDQRVVRDFEKFQNKDFSNSLDDLLPKSLIPEVIYRSDIDPRIKVNQIDKKMRQALINVIKGLKFRISNLEDIDKGIVTAGGVDVKDVNPKTMESKKLKGLYFVGEVLDVDGLTGGFNIQIALSSGYLAGITLASNT